MKDVERSEALPVLVDILDRLSVGMTVGPSRAVMNAGFRVEVEIVSCPIATKLVCQSLGNFD